MSRQGRITRSVGAGALLLLLGAGPLPAQQPAPQQPVCPACPDATTLIQRYGLRESDTPVRARVGWQAPRRVVVLGSEDWAAVLRAAVPSAEVVAVASLEQVPAALPGADVYIGFCTPAVLNAGTHLKWIQLLSAGADQCAAAPRTADQGILLTNAQALYGPPVADHAMALLLTLTRNLVTYREQQAGQQWSHAPAAWRALPGQAAWELEGKTMLIVGLGGIGTEIARRAHGFGMHVMGTRNTRRDAPEFVQYVGLSNEARELAGSADVVVNAAPLTPATRGMFNAAFFRAMKPTALFINIARGESMITADLVQALREGTIAGAGLDVTDPEPLPAGHPLWSMRNVVLTPHSAGASDGLDHRLLALVAENLRRYASGGRVLSIVNLQRGY